MVKRRYIGFVIFGLCTALSARLALLDSKRPQLPTPTEERWEPANKDKGDSVGFIHAVQYWIYGAGGLLGLLIVVEDYVSEKSRKKNQPPVNPPRPTR
jgi:hypothetical protein